MKEINELYQRLLQSYTQGEFFILLIKSLIDKIEKDSTKEDKDELIFDLQEINILCSVDREKILRLEKLLLNLVSKYQITDLSLQEDDLNDIVLCVKSHFNEYEQQRALSKTATDSRKRSS